MEPASIVGLVGSVASLLVLTGKVSKDIHGMIDKYGNVTNTLREINQECIYVGAGLKRLKSRLDDSRGSHGTDDNTDIQICLESFTFTLTKLEEEITRLLVRNTIASSARRTRSKISFLWNEDILKDHCQQVRNQRDALHFVISSWNL